MSELNSLAEKSPRKIDYMYMYPTNPHKNSSNTTGNKIEKFENLTHYYLLTCRIVVNVIV